MLRPVGRAGNGLVECVAVGGVNGGEWAAIGVGGRERATVGEDGGEWVADGVGGRERAPVGEDGGSGR
jgi:hypothetical protein